MIFENKDAKYARLNSPTSARKNKRTMQILVIMILVILCGQYGFAVDRAPLKLKETPLGFYEETSSCHCGGLRTIKNLPSSHILDVTPVKDQNPLGTCVSFTATACGEYFYPKYRFSEAEFTILAETRDNEDCKSGLFLGKALFLANDMGFVRENRFPYGYYLKCIAKQNGINTQSTDWLERLREMESDDVEICHLDGYNETMRGYGIDIELSGNPTENRTPYRFSSLFAIHHISKSSLKTALRYQAGLGQRFSRMSLSAMSTTAPVQKEKEIGSPLAADIQSVRRALYCGLPVAAAINVYGDWDDPKAGIIQMPDETTGDGSHAIVITGYNDVTQYFTFKNSWGLSWGNNGFGSLPYDYLRLYATELVAVKGRQ